MRAQQELEKQKSIACGRSSKLRGHELMRLPSLSNLSASQLQEVDLKREADESGDLSIIILTIIIHTIKTKKIVFE